MVMHSTCSWSRIEVEYIDLLDGKMLHSTFLFPYVPRRRAHWVQYALWWSSPCPTWQLPERMRARCWIATASCIRWLPMRAWWWWTPWEIRTSRCRQRRSNLPLDRPACTSHKFPKSTNSSWSAATAPSSMHVSDYRLCTSFMRNTWLAGLPAASSSRKKPQIFKSRSSSLRRLLQLQTADHSSWQLDLQKSVDRLELAASEVKMKMKKKKIRDS